MQATAWSNGPAGNAQTNLPEGCTQPPYATHDYVADYGLMLLSAGECDWLMPHRVMYLLGKEAPDNDDIPIECNSPNTGYDDRRKGQSVEWAADGSGFAVVGEKLIDRAAVRVHEEYSKAVTAYQRGNLSDAAFYLGAMAHYIADVS